MALAPTESRWREAPTLPSIEVRVALRDEAQLSDPLSPAQWWGSIKPPPQDLRPGFSAPSYWEWVLENRFPAVLRTKWVDHFRSTTTEPPGTESRGEEILATRQFAFRVTRIRYGSLSFDIEIAGLESLVKLLNNNFDLFQMLTEIYVPQAFESAFDLLNTNTAHIEYSYAPSTAVTQAFSAPPAASVPTQLQQVTNASPPSTATSSVTSSIQGRDERRQWFWMVTNYSLIVPVFLSLLVLWAFVNTSDRLTSRQLELTKLMLDQQKTFVEGQTRRNTEMERLTLDALRQVLLSTTKAEKVEAKAEKSDGTK